MQSPNYEKQLEELEKKKSAIIAKEKQIKAKMSGEKRKKENHAKMVLGGAVFGVLKSELPADRKELDLYGRALKKVFENKQEPLLQMINVEYQRLKKEQQEKNEYFKVTVEENENATVDYKQHENY